MYSQESFLINIILIITYLAGILIARYTKYEHKEIKNHLDHIKKLFIMITTFLLFFQITNLTITLIITIIISLILSLTQEIEITNIITWILLITINIIAITKIDVIMIIALIVLMTGIQDEIKYIKIPTKLSMISATRIVGIIITSILTIL
ncbi:hypothetical protein K9L67_05240 [Candidatus Woesearchaeota archaeon]|nr:hypothetical protein [Candidatus Woesearchaeota archaeon]MCF7901603.1 hypothetical protein [Candidatus Woesearchaeota archaeon]MCF8013524.1 hypothetical protein [Candidatus Woesearchaeota archaeon]